MPEEREDYGGLGGQARTGRLREELGVGTTLPESSTSAPSELTDGWSQYSE